MTENQFEWLMKELTNQRQELTAIRKDFIQVVNYMHDAESEVPEKMRRFVMYIHDLNDITHLYEERGHQAPAHVMRELERCHDRLRQLLEKLHEPGGAFEKVRREMADDPNNLYDHILRIAKPQGAVP